MLEDKELMDLHVRTLFCHDANSQLLFINEPGNQPLAPRLFFGRTKTVNLWRFRVDLPKILVGKLEELCADEPVTEDLRTAPKYLSEYLKLLDTSRSPKEMWNGPAYYFSHYCEPSRTLLNMSEAYAELLRGGFEKLIPELSAWQPFLAIAEKGRAVSVCRSVRITPIAHEAGVETLPAFRGKGYAQDVVSGWARAVHSLGAIPLYSTSWANTASQAVARNLNLVAYGADFSIS